MRTTLLATIGILLVFSFGSTAFGQKAKLWTAPKAGLWRVTGSDEQKTRWSARMHLTKTAAKGSSIKYRGYFYWWSPDTETKGYEYFTGRFDRASGILSLKSSRVRSIKGELGIGSYSARARRGVTIHSGTWAGEDSIPGTWSAKWTGRR